jgi:hypothetical protein
LKNLPQAWYDCLREISNPQKVPYSGNIKDGALPPVSVADARVRGPRGDGLGLSLFLEDARPGAVAVEPVAEQRKRFDDDPHHRHPHLPAPPLIFRRIQPFAPWAFVGQRRHLTVLHSEEIDRPTEIRPEPSAVRTAMASPKRGRGNVVIHTLTVLESRRARQRALIWRHALVGQIPYHYVLPLARLRRGGCCQEILLWGSARQIR